MDPRTPILIGGGQLNQREDPVEPVDMIVRAARFAGVEAGAPDIVGAIDSVRIVGMLSWRYRNPGLLVGDRLGAHVRHTVYTGNGGSHPQALVNDAAADIAAGRCDVVLVGGAEAWRTRMALRAQGEKPDWTRQGDEVPAPQLHPDVPMRTDLEVRAGADRPIYVYPLFEQALRLAASRSIASHEASVASLWARFSEVAASNPAAWSQRAYTAEEIASTSRHNRPIASPYTKLMVSNNNVEQSAAVIVCSVEAARRHGVPEDRWVFLRAGAEASDTAAVAARPSLSDSVALRAAASAALVSAGVDRAALGPVDLYSCFPSAVQVAAAAVGLPIDDPARPLTITGGLTFAGGPWNNYTTHAIATMLGEVRRTQQPGLVTANSGYLTKHSVGVYAPTPGTGFRRTSQQATADAVAPVPIAEGHTGPAELESWTVVFDRDGNPESAIAALRTPDGARTLARSVDRYAAAELLGQEEAGRKVDIREPGAFVLD